VILFIKDRSFILSFRTEKKPRKKRLFPGCVCSK